MRPSSRGPGTTTRPSWRIMPRSSLTPQCSTALPSLKRTKCMWLLRNERPVGGSPISEPLWVPLTVKRPATMSPSATSSSISKCRSGKALRPCDRPSHRLGATVRTRRGRVVYEVGSDQLVREGEGPQVRQLLGGDRKGGGEG